MELLQYWEIVRRRWWLPVGLGLLALLASSVVALRGAAAYNTVFRLAISTLPTVDRTTAQFYDPVYYANLSSEYVADDLSEIIRGEAFAAEVAAVIQQQVDARTISNATRARKTHRLLDVTITTATPEQGNAIGQGMVRILNDPPSAARYLRSLDAYNAQVALVNAPVTHRAATPAGIATEVGLRTLVGLLLGLGLAFLVDYVDQSLRTRKQVEDLLGLPVLGEIPRARSGRAARSGAVAA